jgi:hypothetical protein
MVAVGGMGTLLKVKNLVAGSDAGCSSRRPCDHSDHPRPDPADRKRVARIGAVIRWQALRRGSGEADADGHLLRAGRPVGLADPVGDSVDVGALRVVVTHLIDLLPPPFGGNQFGVEFGQLRRRPRVTDAEPRAAKHGSLATPARVIGPRNNSERVRQLRVAGSSKSCNYE